MKEIYEKLRIYTIIFIFGAASYCILELFYKGSSHWSMAICGGICFSFIYFMSNILRGAGILKIALISTLFITICELIFGFIFNILLGYNIWDYANERLNFLGQICIKFSTLWFILSIPSIYLSRIFKKCLE